MMYTDLRIKQGYFSHTLICSYIEKIFKYLRALSYRAIAKEFYIPAWQILKSAASEYTF